MSSTLNFFQSPHVIALLIAVLIFITTIFLVVKRWIGFSLTLLLLLFSLIAGLIINHQSLFNHYLNPSSFSANSLVDEDSQSIFHKQMLQAVEDLKTEVSTEKENLRLVANQIQEIFDSMDSEKQKLQNFIEETRERFKAEYPIKQAPAAIDTQVNKLSTSSP